jgi:hypothetical protein
VRRHEPDWHVRRRVAPSKTLMTHNRMDRGYLSAIPPLRKFVVARLPANAPAAGRIWRRCALLR